MNKIFGDVILISYLCIMITLTDLQDCNLITLKDGVDGFERNGAIFNPYQIYRVCGFNNIEAVVYGEPFTLDEINEKFELTLDRVKRDFKSIGLIQPNGKPISKAGFKRLCQIHEYGRGHDKTFKGIFFVKDSDHWIYSFDSMFNKSRKTDFIDVIYEYMLEIINDDWASLDNNCVQFGNCGIPLTYSRYLRIRYKPDIVWVD